MNLLPPGSTVTTEDAYEAVGHHIGDDYNFATDRQRLCWKTDSFDNIKSAFLRFVVISLRSKQYYSFCHSCPHSFFLVNLIIFICYEHFNHYLALP